MKKFLLKLKKMLLFSVSVLILPVNALAGSIPNCTPGVGTIKNFLATAMQPVGQTLYIYGGGWNDEDTAAGYTSKHIGVWPQWKKFFDKQNGSYNFCDYAISQDGTAETPIPQYLPFGLDCSGYQGWLLYNILHVKNGEGLGYVFSHAERVSNFIENKWGFSIKPEDIKDYKAGDIMDKPGHVYMSIGQCSDGSVVFIHSSPPGVHICGTVTPDGNEKSEAAELAAKYMKIYYPEWNKKFSHKGYTRNKDYLTKYTQLRWNIEGTVKDPDGYTKMTPEQVLENLFDEKIIL